MQLNQHKTDIVIKKHDKRPQKRTSHLSNVEKWELLTAYMVMKNNQEKSKNNVLKWRNLVVKLLNMGEDDYNK